MPKWVALIVGVDLLTSTAAAGAALTLRFGDNSTAVDGVSYGLLGASLPGLWVTTMAMAGAYERRFLVTGAEEFRRVCNGAIWLLAAIASLAFVLHSNVSRAVVGIAVPLAMALTLVSRYGIRKGLHRQLMSGRPIHRLVIAGTKDEVTSMVRHLRRSPHNGLAIVGACLPEGQSGQAVVGTGVPVVGTAQGLLAAVRSVNADTIAIAGSDVLRNLDLRRLSWQLEGTGIDLIVAPAVTDVAGPRICVRPLDGLPLLHVDQPRFSGVHRAVKEIFDLIGAALALVLLAPLLLGIALCIKFTSRGPVIYRQVRTGLRGEPFVLLKFRTMRVGAEAERDHLWRLNESDDVMFKIRRDPRITRIGRWLRRYSLDELPQLWNVLLGQMSLVGPRPPLPDEVAQYADETRRRLLVKPGMSGLWQVSGRSDVSWDETVRLDLYYVEHWSVWLDIMVLWKTIGAVLGSRGAY